MPRKKRRKLEAAREMLGDENQMKKLEVCSLLLFVLIFFHLY